MSAKANKTDILTPERKALEVGKEYVWNCTPGFALQDCKQCYDGCNGCKPFVADRADAYICRCKRTKTPPYCDGSHTT